MSDTETNPVLENVDDALDVVEKFIGEKIKSKWIRAQAQVLMSLLRSFLQVPDNIGGDAD